MGFITVGGAMKGTLFVGAVTLSAYGVAKAPSAQGLHTATRDVAGLAGAAYGAEVGAAIGSAMPGAGTSSAVSSEASSQRCGVPRGRQGE
ncbi:hypothetical protein [Streptomyces sp. NPDC102487]|uniref:hypothetical protein n=1 Tax=Streptomyces sp. NPDC102487 TaxID=3366182 RepID=UPI00380EA87E